MDVQVRLSAGLTSLAGNSRLAVTLAEEATVADLLEYLRTQHPELAARMDRAVPIVSGRHVAPDTPLANGQEVALLLPVAGGAC